MCPINADVKHLHYPNVRAYIETLLLDQKVNGPLVEAILRHLEIQKTITTVDGALIQTDDGKAQGEAQDRVLKALGFKL